MEFDEDVEKNDIKKVQVVQIKFQISKLSRRRQSVPSSQIYMLGRRHHRLKVWAAMPARQSGRDSRAGTTRCQRVSLRERKRMTVMGRKAEPAEVEDSVGVGEVVSECSG